MSEKARAALQAVEFVNVFCPWCGGKDPRYAEEGQQSGHEPTCLRLAGLEEAEREQMPVQYRHLPWLGGKGILFAVYGSSSAHYADELEARITTLEKALAEIAKMTSDRSVRNAVRAALLFWGKSSG